MQNDFLADWKFKPVRKPTVDQRFEKLDALSQSAECIRYTVLSVEHWISPDGHIREWLRRNLLLGAWLIIPAVFVMPTVGFILWQVNEWLSMLTGIFGKLILLPLLVLLTSIVIRIVTAFLKR